MQKTTSYLYSSRTPPPRTQIQLDNATREKMQQKKLGSNNPNLG